MISLSYTSSNVKEKEAGAELFNGRSIKARLTENGEVFLLGYFSQETSPARVNSFVMECLSVIYNPLESFKLPHMSVNFCVGWDGRYLCGRKLGSITDMFFISEFKDRENG